MELVYLWVEDYKNIHHQGFNFSPRFTCSYDEEKQELTIDKKDDYVSIFPQNINVTAIVGENGSGKSSLLNTITNEGIVIYKNGKFYANTTYKIKNYPVEILDFEKEIKIVHINSDLIKISYIKDAWDAYRLNMYDENLYTPKNDSPTFTDKIDLKAFEKQIIELIQKYYNSFQNNLFHFNPTKLKLSFNPLMMYKNHIESVMYQDKEQEKLSKTAKNIYDIVKKDTNLYNKLLVYFYVKRFFTNEKLPSEFIEVQSLLELENEVLAKQEFLTDAEIINAKELFTFLENKKVFENSFDIGIFFKELAESGCKNIFFRLMEIDFIKINFLDNKSLNYFDLSQGERKFFSESLMIFDELKETSMKDILLVLDEPDLSLHPDWQKRYVHELLNLLSSFPEKNIHIIITSHSPFILSDLPKENVIFLEKYKKDEDKNQKEGNCKNVTSEINIETFGANIHTLLSHGFFMKDGLMGEFAKGKITEIKKFYDENKNLQKENANFQTQKDDYDAKKHNFRHIQSIIGEPFLKTIMKNYLDELELLFSDDEDLINKELEALEKRKLYLEKLKNAKD